MILASCLYACDFSPKEIIEEATSEEVRSTTDNPLYNDLMMPVSGQVFRGADFDMSRNEIYTLESNRSTVTLYSDENEEELIFTTDMGKDILNFADITYRFDEQGLYNIKVETYATSSKIADEVYHQIIEHYTSLYGEPTIAEDGYDEFYAVDKNTGYDYRISILNITDLEESFGMYMYFDLI